jgi:hypothetical protein
MTYLFNRSCLESFDHDPDKLVLYEEDIKAELYYYG